MAYDCPSNAERMDWPEGCRWKTSGRYLESAPGSDHGSRVPARPFENPGRLVEELQAGGALRFERQTDPGTGGPRTPGKPQNGCQSACKRWSVAQGSRDARLPRLCGRSP